MGTMSRSEMYMEWCRRHLSVSSCPYLGENQASTRKTGVSHSRMRTEEKLESAMVEQCVLEIQG